MLKIREYVKAESLEQAYALNQKNGCILGGMLWLKMGNRTVQTAIDLSGLGLDEITETEEEFSIGCMTTLRRLELHEGLNRFGGGAFRESVRTIVGVQFRNLATVGGSIFGRYGFSDVLTCFLAFDSYVELYKGGVMPLEEFAASKRDKDILVRLIVKKTPVRCVYLSHRNTKTDFPVLTCAVSAGPWGVRAVVGARPQRAVCVPVKGVDALGAAVCQNTDAAEVNAVNTVNTAQIEAAARETADKIPTSGNMRAGAAYRSHLAHVLIRRALTRIWEEEKGEKEEAEGRKGGWQA